MNQIYQTRDLDRLCKSTVSIIENELFRVGFVFRIFSRVKTSDSTNSKIVKKGELYYNGETKFIRDIIGVRIILYFPDDVSIIQRSLKDIFTLVEETIDVVEETKFAPTRKNLIFRLPSGSVKEFEEITNNRIFDSTFEVQIRTILAEGWHEIDHDLRYKCKDDWTHNVDLSRIFNGILAAIETSEYSILRLFEQLSFRHYKEKNIPAMVRTKFRLRFEKDSIAEELQILLTDNIIRDLFKIDRLEIIEFLYKNKFSFPITIESLIYTINYFFIKNTLIIDITPDLLIVEFKQSNS